MIEYIIRKVDNGRVADFIGLNDHKLRQRREESGGDMSGFFIGEGVTVIERAIESGHALLTLIVNEQFKLSQFKNLPDGLEVLRCGGEVLEAISGRPDLKDPIGSFRRPVISKLTSVIEGAEILLLTESVHNPTNMGMIMRNAAAFGVDAVCVDSSSCDPLYRRAVRVSMGQVFSVPHVRVDTIPATLDFLQAHGFLTVALTPNGKADELRSVLQRNAAPIALIVGSEGPGLSAETLDLTQEKARIPMKENVDSLNVATAVAVALYAVNDYRSSLHG
ncbi:MAG: RNA methyltransferase [Actinomycetota bacterium]